MPHSFVRSALPLLLAFSFGCTAEPEALDQDGSEIVDRETFTVHADPELDELALHEVLTVRHVGDLELGSARLIELFDEDRSINQHRLVLAFSDQYGDRAYDLEQNVDRVDSFVHEPPRILQIRGTQSRYEGETVVSHPYSMFVSYGCASGPTCLALFGAEGLTERTEPRFEALAIAHDSHALQLGDVDVNFVQLFEGGEAVTLDDDAIVQINPVALYLTLNTGYGAKTFKVGDFIAALNFTAVGRDTLRFEVLSESRELIPARWQYEIRFRKDGGDVASAVQVSYGEIAP